MQNIGNPKIGLYLLGVRTFLGFQHVLRTAETFCSRHPIVAAINIGDFHGHSSRVQNISGATQTRKDLKIDMKRIGKYLVSQINAAKEIDVPVQYISHVLSGRRGDEKVQDELLTLAPKNAIHDLGIKDTPLREKAGRSAAA
jgi:hypothetical protein